MAFRNLYWIYFARSCPVQSQFSCYSNHNSFSVNFRQKVGKNMRTSRAYIRQNNLSVPSLHAASNAAVAALSLGKNATRVPGTGNELLRGQEYRTACRPAPVSSWKTGSS